jgi:cell division protein FtsB
MIPMALANWGKVLVGMIVLILGVYIAILNSRITNLRAQVKESQAEIVLWKQTYAVLSQKVAEQNAAINKLEDARKTALKKRAQSDKKAAAIVAHQKDTETRLNAITQAPEASSACEAELGAIKQMLEAAK